MTSYELRFDKPEDAGANPAQTFFWRTNESSTIDGRLLAGPRVGPRLGALGPVAERNVDLVRIAVAVFAADRSTPRKGGGSNWNRRPIELTIPVLDPGVWNAAGPQLKSLVDLLSGDDWTFHFASDNSEDERITNTVDEPTRVVLLSGGADSALGALRSGNELDAGESHTLVSHWSSSVQSSLQARIAATLHTLLPDARQRHVQGKLSRRAERYDEKRWRSENSQRSRSLLFLALGLAVASIDDVPVWIPENGFASLNPPVSPERLGSVSTRTTHPAFLAGLDDLLRDVGAHAEVHNPFMGMTKGEMFRWAADLVGDGPAAELLSATHSCAHSGQRTFHISTKVSCGVCFGCLVRRAAFQAADLEDTTEYVDAADDPQVERWLDEKSLAEAVRRFVARGVSTRDIVAMGLPKEIRVSDALDLCRRGLAELALLG